MGRQTESYRGVFFLQGTQQGGVPTVERFGVFDVRKYIDGEPITHAFSQWNYRIT